MQATEELIRSVVQEVLAHMRNGKAAPANGKKAAPAGGGGVFDDVDAAVAAAAAAQRQFEARGLDDRRKAVDCIRRVCSTQAEALGREELDETKIGRLPHKVEKLRVVADRIPG